MAPVATDQQTNSREHAIHQCQPASGRITTSQLESAVREFHRREETWGGADNLKVLVARQVTIEHWRRFHSKLQLMTTDSVFADVFFEVEFDADADANGYNGDPDGLKPANPLVDVFISKIASTIHQEVRKSIVRGLSSSSANIGDHTVLDLTPAAVVIPPSRNPTQSPQRSIQKRPDLAIQVVAPQPCCLELAADEDASSIRIVIDIEDHHVRPLDSLMDLSDEYFRALPLLYTAVFVRIFRRRISRRFACVAIVMQRAAPSSNGSSVSGVITDTVSFGSCSLSANRVVSRIRQLTRVSNPQPIQREMEPLAPHDQKFGNLWATNPSNPLHRPYILIPTSAEEAASSARLSNGSSRDDANTQAVDDGGGDGSALKLRLWPIYQIAHEQIPIRA